MKRPSLVSLYGRQFDVIVVGGGITGAGVAQDAASRGLRTLICEKGDFASGTSSKSTKLIHGGLRYLENFQFGVVLESVRERQMQRKLAPHLVHSLPFIIPVYKRNWLNNWKWEAGLWLYDVMAGLSDNRFHSRLSRQDVLSLLPGIDENGLTGGIQYFDGRTDDARHTLEVIKSAVEHGAVALNYAPVSEFIRRNGKVVGVRVYQTDNSQASAGAIADPVDVFAGVVVNATGVWTQKTAELGGASSTVKVSPAKGIHITLPQARLPIKSAMLIPTGGDGRFCFAVPWYDSVVVGTTDTPYDGDLDDIKVLDEEVDYVLSAVNAQFPSLKVTESDITGRFAGLRPLISDAPARGKTTKISRKHKLEEAGDGLVTIAGGKLTTYRVMAAETVDLVASVLSRQGRHVGRSVTDRLMLGGWASENEYRRLAPFILNRAAELGLGVRTASTLVFMYGKRACDVLSLVEADRSLGAPLVDGHAYIKAQVVYAVRAECAITVDDVLSRRLRLSITDEKAAFRALHEVSRIMSELLSWSPEKLAAEIQSFASRLAPSSAAAAV